MTPARFVAVIDRHRVSSAPEDRPLWSEGFEIVFQNAFLTVRVSAGTPTVDLDNRGIIVGPVFKKGSSAAVECLDGGSPSSLARTLVDHCWGDYVALLVDPERPAVHVLRAPSGGLHAFRARRGTTTFLASDIEKLHSADPAAATIDWAFVAHHLAFSHLHTRRTGLAGIDEIVPGDCAIEHGLGSETVTLWTPWRFAPLRTKRAPSLEAAAAAVRSPVIQAIEALTKPSDRLALELSGGLDSSIVAAGLAAAGRQAVAVNLVTPGPEGDERPYARAVAERCAMPLVEAMIDGEIDLTAVPRTVEARPGMLAMLRLADQLFIDVGRDHEVTGFINGTGGDCVFCSLGTAAPAADRLTASGIGPGLLRTIRDVAEVHNVNIWKVAGLTAERARRGRPVPIWRRNTHFLAEDRLPLEPDDHPWLREPRSAFSGTRAHIHAILASYAHLDGYGRHEVAPSIFPLLSQPVVEACVAIPSWLWVAGGRDRAVARAAFGSLLPAKTINRRTKGGMEAFCARTFELNRDRLKPFLLDGLIAGAGLLDRPAIETYLARAFSNRDALFYHLLPIVDVELWARAVTSEDAGSPAAMARQR